MLYNKRKGNQSVKKMQTVQLTKNDARAKYTRVYIVHYHVIKDQSHSQLTINIYIKKSLPQKCNQSQ